MAYSRAEAMGIELSHQRSEVGSDLGGLRVNRKVPLLGYPAEYQGEPRTQGHGKVTVGRRAVADDRGTVEVTVEAGAHKLGDRSVGLARHRGFDAGCGRNSGEDGTPSGDRSFRRRVGRVVVGAD